MIFDVMKLSFEEFEIGIYKHMQQSLIVTSRTIHYS